ncbi:MAG: SulP family inorganic anion transporter, partial [Sphingomonas sp.]|uniref:SulP family inorganic anion transporter n=1 Tax=Sphingomonas sp. TaxID=28214 RepID=UPI003F3FD606
MLPEAVAYAGIAGLPPARALVAAIVGSAAYLLVGRSRVAIVSPTSSSATILAAALAAMGATVGDREALATVLIAIVGLIFLAAGALRLGALSSFVSRPVLRGFALGLAITIIVHQLPTLFGIIDDGRSIGSTALTLAAGLGRVNPISTVTGVGALISLLLLRRWRMVPGALVVLTLGIVASITLDLSAHGVAVVGPIVVTFTVPRFPPMSAEAMLRLAQLAAPLTLILFAESWGTIRTLALRHDDKVDPGRELVGLGVANLVSAFAQGMPVGAGFSAASANEGAGGSSKLAALTASLALAVLVALAMPLIAQLPKPVLAAVVIAALTHALDPAWLVQLWRLKRDALIALTATAGVLLLGVVNGMLLAILLSVVAFIRRASRPHVARLGRLGQSHDYVSLARHPEAIAPWGVTIWRPDEPLFFANAEPVLDHIAAAIDPAS